MGPRKRAGLVSVAGACCGHNLLRDERHSFLVPFHHTLCIAVMTSSSSEHSAGSTLPVSPDSTKTTPPPPVMPRNQSPHRPREMDQGSLDLAMDADLERQLSQPGLADKPGQTAGSDPAGAVSSPLALAADDPQSERAP